MPFRLTNTPASFQVFINNVLRQYLDVFVVVYLDDILVYSRTRKEYIEHVRKVLEVLKKVDLRIKLKKSEFHKREVTFLGYIVSLTGFKIDPDKIRVVTG